VKVRIRTRDGVRTVPGMRTTTPGLVLACSMPEDSWLFWALTHERSGLLLTRHEDHRALRAIAKDLAPLADWTRSAEDLRNAVDAVRRRTIIEAHGASLPPGQYGDGSDLDRSDQPVSVRRAAGIEPVSDAKATQRLHEFIAQLLARRTAAQIGEPEPVVIDADRDEADDIVTALLSPGGRAALLDALDAEVVEPRWTHASGLAGWEFTDDASVRVFALREENQ